MPGKKTASLLLALLLLVLLVIWLASGDSLSSQTQAPEPETSAASEPSAEHFRVETRWMDAQPFTPVEVLQGQLFPFQQLELRAETSGRVTAFKAAEGQQVQQGAELLQLALESRPAQIRRLQAERASRAAELNAAERLRDSNLLSESDLLRLKSSLLQIEADLEAAQLDLAHTRPKAPFSGLLEQRHVELGESVQPGQLLFTLLNINQLKAVAQVPQQRIHALEKGQQVTLQLLDGSELQGQISLIGSLANSGTRTYRVEALLDNPQQLRVAGASATLQIQLNPTNAHYLSLALLSLDNQGRPGVKHVNDQQQVVFSPVQLLSSDNQGAWVSGLPARAQVITLGGGFVSSGDQVTPVVQQQSGAE